MGYWGKAKSEHAGHKGSTRKNGFWGPRREAKATAKRVRRTDDQRETQRFDAYEAGRRAVRRHGEALKRLAD
jgi:hypothetical protein